MSQNYFRAKIADCKQFKKIINNIVGLQTQINLLITYNGITISEMDESHIMLFNIVIERGYFQYYDFVSEDNVPFVVGLNSENLNKVLSAVDNTSFELKYVYGNDEIFFKFEGDNKLEFKFKMMEIISERMEIPEMTYDNDFSLTSQGFSSIVTTIKKLGIDECCFYVFKEKFIITMNNDIGIPKITINIDNEHKNNMAIKLSSKMLEHVSKMCSIFDVITIKLSNEFPACFLYEIDNLSISYHLAPKIVEEGELEDEVCLMLDNMEI